jgi:hypothetical protein
MCPHTSTLKYEDTSYRKTKNINWVQGPRDGLHETSHMSLCYYSIPLIKNARQGQRARATKSPKRGGEKAGLKARYEASYVKSKRSLGL